MLYYENGEWKICPLIANYTVFGEKNSKYTNNRKWWEDFVTKWWHHGSLSFTKVVPTDAQLQRLSEVQDIPKNACAVASTYVETGELVKDEEGSIDPVLDGKTEQPDFTNCLRKKAAKDRRKHEYKTEADPLFLKYQRDERTKQEWLDKVNEIKQRHPYPDEEEKV